MVKLIKNLPVRVVGAILVLLYVADQHYRALGLGLILPYRTMHWMLHPSQYLLPDRWLLGQIIVSAIGGLGMAMTFPSLVASRLRDPFSWLLRLGQRNWLMMASAILFGHGLSFVINDLFQRLLPTGSNYAPFAADLEDPYGWLMSILSISCSWRIMFGDGRRRSDFWLGSALATLVLLPPTIALSNVSLGGWAYFRNADQIIHTAFAAMAVWVGITLSRSKVGQLVKSSAPIVARCHLLLSGLILFYGIEDLILKSFGFRAISWVSITYPIIGISFCGYLAVHLLRATLAAMPLPQETPYPAEALRPRYILSHQFWRHVAIGASASALLIMLGFVATKWMRIFAFVASGPIVVIIAGIVSTRYGYALGTILLLIGIAVVRTINLMS